MIAAVLAGVAVGVGAAAVAGVVLALARAAIRVVRYVSRPL